MHLLVLHVERSERLNSGIFLLLRTADQFPLYGPEHEKKNVNCRDFWEACQNIQVEGEPLMDAI